MSDASNQEWSTSSSEDEYSVKTRREKEKEKIGEEHQSKHKRKKKDKKKRKKSKKSKDSKRRETSEDSDVDFGSEKENTKKINKSDNRSRSDDIRKSMKKSRSRSKSRSRKKRSHSRDISYEKRDNAGSRSHSKGKSKYSVSHAKPASYRSRSPTGRISKVRSKSRSRSKSELHATSRNRSRSHSISRRKSIDRSNSRNRSRDRSKSKDRSRDHSRRTRVSRSRSREKKYSRSYVSTERKYNGTRRSSDRKLHRRSTERRSHSRSRSRGKRRSRSKSKSHGRRRSHSGSRSNRKRRSRSRSRISRRRRSRSRSQSNERHRSRSRGRSSRKRISRSRSKSNGKCRSRSRSRSNVKRNRSSRSLSRKRYEKSKSPVKERPSLKTKPSSSWDVKYVSKDFSSNTTANDRPDKTLSTTGYAEIKDKPLCHSCIIGPKDIEINIYSSVVKKDERKPDPESQMHGLGEACEPKDVKKKDLSSFMKICQEISAKEDVNEEPQDIKDGEKGEEKEKPVHHPFSVKSAPTYYPPQFPVKTPTNPAQAILAGCMVSLMAPHLVEPPLTGPLEKHFPVSSGTDHRNKLSDEANINAAVFDDAPEEHINVSAVIARRLGAQQILNTNPDDYSAKLIMAECDIKLKRWSDQNKKPGKFTGEVGVKMKKREMFAVLGNENYSAIRKDFFHNLKPVSGGVGMKMLQNMGWKEGQALGKSKQGYVAPVSIDVKFGRAGLHSEEEACHFNQPSQFNQFIHTNQYTQVKKEVDPVPHVGGKHPVSALAELCHKRKLGIPDYSIVSETGHSYAKQFLMKVVVQDITYQPAENSPNKKHAKAMAAYLALQNLGVT